MNISTQSIEHGKQAQIRLLLVDDEKNVRAALKRVFRSSDYHIDEAPDGPTALAMLTASAYTVIISDLRMPGMSGTEFLSQATEISPDTAQLLLTGQAEFQDLDAAINQCNITHFVAKPWDAEKLKEIVAQLANSTINDQQESARNQAIKAEIHTAVELQQALLPEEISHSLLNTAWIYEPCSQLGGDGFSYQLTQSKLNFYLLDVVGHGAGAAMESVALQHLMANSDLSQPAEVCRKMNQTYAYRNHPLRYFTMLCGNLDLRTGLLTFCQAGHPHGLLKVRDTGKLVSLGEGGFPIGLVDQAEYQETRFLLSPGDRLLFLSDGLADEEASPIPFLLDEHRNDPLATLRNTITEWCRHHPADDDVSALMLEYKPIQIH